MPSDWLREHLNACDLTAEVEDYLLGRGVKEFTIASEAMKTWQLLPEPSPDPEFRKLFWPHGERLDGMMVCPVWSPKGSMIGFEARNIHQKKILDYRLPQAKWTPFFIGTRAAMPAIWASGDIWIGEGLFDKAALEWAVPPQDAVLATVRAALTHAQLEFLRRFCRGYVHMVYDNDETGRKATDGWVDPDTGKKRRGALELLEGVDRDTGRCLTCQHRADKSDPICKNCGMVHVKCRDVKYSGGKDPGEIWDKGGLVGVRAAFQA